MILNPITSNGIMSDLSPIEVGPTPSNWDWVVLGSKFIHTTSLETLLWAHMMIIWTIDLESHPLKRYILIFYFNRSGSHSQTTLKQCFHNMLNLKVRPNPLPLNWNWGIYHLRDAIQDVRFGLLVCGPHGGLLGIQMLERIVPL